VSLFAGNRTIRVGLLLGAMVVVVALPVILQLQALRSPAAAQREAAHSAEVQKLILQLSRELLIAERHVYADLVGASLDRDRDFNFQQSATDVQEMLQQLRVLTSDNATQQAHVKQLGAIVAARLSMLDRARISELPVARALISNSRTSRPQKNVIDKIVEEEERLLGLRVVNFDEQTRRAEWLAMGGGLAQASLLLLLLVLSERSRLANERAAARTDLERGRALDIVGTVPTPIALLSRDLALVQTNPAFRNLYRAGEKELDGRPLAEVSDGAWSDPSLLQRLNDVAQLGRELWDFGLSQTDGEGRERHVLLNARRLGPDQADFVLLTAIDVTAVRRGEEQVRDLNQQLRGKIEQVSEVNRELEAFSYSVSHDLRAPLRHIAAFAGKLGQEIAAAPGDKAAHYLRVIDESSRRMSQLIDDLLVYSRLGRGAMRMLPIDMQSMVAEVRTMLSSSGSYGIGATWDIGPLPVAEGDENMLRQVWQNLLSNALKYSSKAAQARIVVRAELDRNAHEWVFSIADNGVGFDMAYVEKLFGVFQRLHKASEFPGTGIGLANVRRVVTRHHGRVWAESAPGGGANFCFTLPAVHR